MKKITKDYFDSFYSTPNNQVFKALLECEVGEGFEVDFSEMNTNYPPSNGLSLIAKRANKHFIYRTNKGEKKWLIIRDR
jgi:hypothetical protein